MKRRVVLLGLVVVAGLSGCKKKGGGGKGTELAVHAQAGDVAIIGGTVVPMDREGALTGHTVLLRGDRIIAVAPAATVDTKGATVIDAAGQWVMPGLADMHVHFWGERDLDLFVLNGVTTVRNLFGSPEHVRWRDAIARGHRNGPTIFTAGPIIDGDPPVWPGSAVITTADAARAEVTKQKAAGYDWLKVYNGLSPEVHAALLDEAKKQGMAVAGHVPQAVGIAAVIASGQRTIEHLDGYIPFKGDAVMDPDIVKKTVAAGIWNCPTLVVTDRFGQMDNPVQLAGTRGLELVAPSVMTMWDPKRDFRLQKFTPEMFEAVRIKNRQRRALVRDLQDAGAHLVLGTDTGNPYVIPGFAVADELVMLVESGLSPAQALRMATVAAAEVQGTAGAFGIVAANARADLIILAKDPLADVANVADPVVVVVRGKVFRRDELLAAVNKPAASVWDRMAGLRALAPEGTELFRASYDVLMYDQVIGAERFVASREGLGPMVIKGDLIFTAPQEVTVSYRSTRDELDVTTDGLVPPRVVVTRKGGSVVAVQDGKPPVELAVAADAVIAPQTVAEFVWYTPALTSLAVGAKVTVTAAEVRTDGAVALDPGSFAFTRAADDAGRRAYDFVGKYGDLEAKGRLVLDADGAPAEVVVTVKWGTFTTRRKAAGG